jgi:hypothetical protein
MADDILTTDARSVSIQQDATGNVIITGEGNLVVFQSAHQLEPEQTKPRSAIGPNPYKGLDAFTEQDASRFFGREQLVQKLREQFYQLHQVVPGQPPSIRLLPLIGPSGCGKSSFARAGLIPELVRHPFTGWQRVRAALITPGAHPIDALATLLARIAPR